MDKPFRIFTVRQFGFVWFFLARTRKNAGTDAGVAWSTDPVGPPGHST
jgi:hypothetical protein